ncbi:hypothetical protein C7S18_10220 [Ahniella affigens]|uniref:Uncharacterized protein n=1 Tax=Ahniella affigens TaxID=2021234 RepID=A0A2P1PRR8_9GAMM|nr:hypothetical protein [Ahniella affigens]AVP97547.1 hypothetical protein C7S18_10220 [Ahniella affigens]
MKLIAAFLSILFAVLLVLTPHYSHAQESGASATESSAPTAALDHVNDVDARKEGIKVYFLTFWMVLYLLQVVGVIRICRRIVVDGSAESLFDVCFSQPRTWAFIVIAVLVPVALSAASGFADTKTKYDELVVSTSLSAVLVLVTLELSTLLDMRGEHPRLTVMFYASLALDVVSYFLIALGVGAHLNQVSQETILFCIILVFAACVSSVATICLVKQARGS